MRRLVFVIKTAGCLAWEAIKYPFHRSRLEALKGIATGLQDNVFYLKMFQALAGDVDLLTQDEADFFTEYTDSVPWTEEDISNGFRNTVSAVNESLEDKDKVVNIGKTPYKSGTMSLVYEAETVEGEKMVVKVLRRDILRRLEEAYGDVMALVRIISHLPFARHLGLVDILTTNWPSLLRQTSLLCESEHLKRMGDNFEDVPGVVLPRCIKEFTQADGHMLVMSRLEGKTLRQVSDENCEEYAKRVAAFTVKCVFHDGFYHGDLHAGNVLFMGPKSEGRPLRIGVMDLGIAGTFNGDEQRNFIEFFRLGFIEKRVGEAAEYMIKNCTVETSSGMQITVVDAKIRTATTKLENELDRIVKAGKDIGPRELSILNRILGEASLKLDNGFLRGELAMSSAIGVASALAHRGGREYLAIIMEVVNAMLAPMLLEN
jgi:predicted unusual protein kinase regulating ubiquinone biosynthesis (AarF/ABC1/UbiB family)